MFEKRKKQQLTVLVRDKNESIILSSRLLDLPIEEKGMLQLSMEFFQDPDPCEIHRGAVRNRSLQHLKLACPPGEPQTIEALDPLLQVLFPPEAKTVQLVEE